VILIRNLFILWLIVNWSELDVFLYLKHAYHDLRPTIRLILVNQRFELFSVNITFLISSSLKISCVTLVFGWSLYIYVCVCVCVCVYVWIYSIVWVILICGVSGYLVLVLVLPSIVNTERNVYFSVYLQCLIACLTFRFIRHKHIRISL